MKGTWQGSGTWQTTGGGGGCGLVVVVLLLLALGSGAAAAIASLIATIIAVIAIGAGAVAVMIIAGLGYLAWRRRRGGREHRQVIPRPRYHQLAAPEPDRPAIEGRAPAALDQAGPRELHQHWHFHGIDEDRVAEILRRHQAG